MGIIDVAGNPLAKTEKQKKKEPSPLSMRTGDMLAQMEGASPIAASSMMRGLGDVERQRGQNEQGLAMLHRKHEMERVGGQKTDKLLSMYEWAQITHPDLWAKRHGRVSRRENKIIEEGYTTYLTFQKAKQEQAFNQARIGTQQAAAGSYGRANRPKTLGAQMMWFIQQDKPIPPVLSKMYEARFSQLPGLASKEGIAARGLTSTEGMAGRKLGAEVDWRGADRGMKRREGRLGRGAAMRRSVSDRAGRMDVARLKGGVEKPLLTDAKINSAIVAGRNIGKVGKDGEKVDFKTWMLESYLPIARSTKPEQRATIFKAVGKLIPSEDELLGMLQEVPAGKPSRLFGLIGAKPPSRKAIEGGFDELDYVLEALKLRGASNAKIEQLRAMFSDKLLDAREAPTGG